MKDCITVAYLSPYAFYQYITAISATLHIICSRLSESHLQSYLQTFHSKKLSVEYSSIFWKEQCSNECFNAVFTSITKPP